MQSSGLSSRPMRAKIPDMFLNNYTSLVHMTPLCVLLSLPQCCTHNTPVASPLLNSSDSVTQLRKDKDEKKDWAQQAGSIYLSMMSVQPVRILCMQVYRVLSFRPGNYLFGLQALCIASLRQLDMQTFCCLYVHVEQRANSYPDEHFHNHTYYVQLAPLTAYSVHSLNQYDTPESVCIENVLVQTRPSAKHFVLYHPFRVVYNET